MNHVLRDNHGRKIGEIIDQVQDKLFVMNMVVNLASLMENTLVMIMEEKWEKAIFLLHY